VYELGHAITKSTLGPHGQSLIYNAWDSCWEVYELGNAIT